VLEVLVALAGLGQGRLALVAERTRERSLAVEILIRRGAPLQAVEVPHGRAQRLLRREAFRFGGCQVGGDRPVVDTQDDVALGDPGTRLGQLEDAAREACVDAGLGFGQGLDRTVGVDLDAQRRALRPSAPTRPDGG